MREQRAAARRLPAQIGKVFRQKCQQDHFAFMCEMSPQRFGQLIARGQMHIAIGDIERGGRNARALGGLPVGKREAFIHKDRQLKRHGTRHFPLQGTPCMAIGACRTGPLKRELGEDTTAGVREAIMAKAIKLDELLHVKLENGRTIGEELKSVRWLARLLDSRFSIFGVKFGLDAMIGLVPVAGDVVTGIAGLVSLIAAARLKVPPHMLGLMVIYLAVDLLFGSVPVFGDVFDFFFRAHKRNLRVIEQHVAKRAAKVATAA